MNNSFQTESIFMELKNISLSFGGLKALQNVNLKIYKREVLAIIGPNGAGKSSMLNVISGIYHPQEGDVYWDGKLRPIIKPHDIARFGIARTFQNIALFRGMNALENILTGRNSLMKRSLFLEAFYSGWAKKQEMQHRDKAEEIIEFLEIESIRKVPDSRLPYGLQKRVELGRALAAEPKVLLLDEPMAGMNLEEKEDMCRFILDANQQFSITVVLIEHDMGVVMDISDRVAVLDYGRKIADGPPESVRNNQKVIDAYLGAN